MVNGETWFNKEGASVIEIENWIKSDMKERGRKKSQTAPRGAFYTCP